MLRRLFACFALLTGLVAVGAPAQAHMEISRIEAGLCQAAGDATEATKAPHPRVKAHAYVHGRSALAMAQIPGCLYPSVRLGIDRARE